MGEFKYCNKCESKPACKNSKYCVITVAENAKQQAYGEITSVTQDRQQRGQQP
jgi:hypothetical protein